MPIANAEHRHAQFQNGWINIGTAGLQDAGRAAGNNEAPPGFELSGGSVAGDYICVDAELANAAGN